MGDAGTSAGSAQATGTDQARQWVNARLSGEWSAPSAAGGLNADRLTTLVRIFGTLDSMVKVRLLLSGLFVPSSERERLLPLLLDLRAQAASSQDEWVKATAAMVGEFEGPLDLPAVADNVPVVRSTVSEITAQLQGASIPPQLFSQVEHLLHPDVRRGRPPAPPPDPMALTPREAPQVALTDLSLSASGSGPPGSGPVLGLLAPAPGHPGVPHSGGSGASSAAGSSLDGRPSAAALVPGGGSSAGASGGSAAAPPGVAGAGGSAAHDPLSRRGSLVLDPGLGAGILRTRSDVQHAKDSRGGLPLPVSSPTGIKPLAGPPAGRPPARVRPLEVPEPQDPQAAQGHLQGAPLLPGAGSGGLARRDSGHTPGFPHRTPSGHLTPSGGAHHLAGQASLQGAGSGGTLPLTPSGGAPPAPELQGRGSGLQAQQQQLQSQQQLHPGEGGQAVKPDPDVKPDIKADPEAQPAAKRMKTEP